MEIVLVEHFRENLLGEDVLDQHFPDVLGGDRGVDRLLCVFEEFDRGFAERRVVALRRFDHRSQSVEHSGQIGLKLGDRLVELGDLAALVAEKQIEQSLQALGVVDRATHDLMPVLDQNGCAAVLKNDVVLRIALAEFLLDLLVEVVLLVLGFPIAERHAQRVEQRAIGKTRVFCKVWYSYCGMKTRSRDLPQSLSSVLNASLTTDSRVSPETRRSVSSSFR